MNMLFRFIGYGGRLAVTNIRGDMIHTFEFPERPFYNNYFA